MSVVRKIKNIPFVRGLAFLYSQYFSVKRNKFGFLADNVRFTPPVQYC